MSTTFAWWCITYFNIFTFESDILNFQFSCFISSFGLVFLRLFWYNFETLKRGIFVDLSLPSLQTGSMVETLGLVSINTNSHYHLLPMTVCELFKAITQAKKVVLFPEISQVKILLSLTRTHSWMCIRIYIFNFKKQQANKQNKTK